MRLVIVESPYAGDIETNTRYAQEALRDCILRGESPLASHLLYPQVLNEHDPDERALGIKCGIAWMQFANAVVFYVDLGWSNGMRAAKAHALRLNMRIEERNIY